MAAAFFVAEGRRKSGIGQRSFIFVFKAQSRCRRERRQKQALHSRTGIVGRAWRQQQRRLMGGGGETEKEDGERRLRVEREIRIVCV